MLSFVSRSINARRDETGHRLCEGSAAAAAAADQGKGRAGQGPLTDLGSEGLKRDDEEMGVSFLHCKTNKTR